MCYLTSNLLKRHIVRVISNGVGPDNVGLLTLAVKCFSLLNKLTPGVFVDIVRKVIIIILVVHWAALYRKLFLIFIIRILILFNIRHTFQNNTLQCTTTTT